MERCFIATDISEFVKDLNEYLKARKIQGELYNRFSEEHGIESNKIIISGDGRINAPFSERNKSNITLSIEPTQKDVEKFDIMLSKPSKHHGLRTFKKNTALAKEFAQKCIDEQIVVNLCHPRVSDYFESLMVMGSRSQWFKHKEVFYLKVESDYLKKDDTPTGFIEIKLSQYYQAQEEIEKSAV